MTTEEWIDRVRAVHGDKYDYSLTEYKNQRSSVMIICPEHGVFEQKADVHLRGHGCSQCGYREAVKKHSREWSDEQRERIARTCLERYGAPRYLDSDAGRLKNREIRSSTEFRLKMREVISSDEVQQKTRATCLERYGVESPMKLSDTLDKVMETKRQRGTWAVSAPENRAYELLCQRFGVEDVERQHKEERYPFWCDFYIRSLDLFIELNATWLHGGHWFDASSEEDMAVLNQWRHEVENGKRFYQVAIETWTVRDVRKRQTAIEQGLNYVVFWDAKLSDFCQWLEADSLVLNNLIEG